MYQMSYSSLNYQYINPQEEPSTNKSKQQRKRDTCTFLCKDTIYKYDLINNTQYHSHVVELGNYQSSSFNTSQLAIN